MTTKQDPASRTMSRSYWQNRVREQEQWIREHGGDLNGYVARYGKPGDPDCYGNGGEAIFEADVAELEKCRAELRALTRCAGCQRQQRDCGTLRGGFCEGCHTEGRESIAARLAKICKDDLVYVATSPYDSPTHSKGARLIRIYGLCDRGLCGLGHLLNPVECDELGVEILRTKDGGLIWCPDRENAKPGGEQRYLTSYALVVCVWRLLGKL